MPESKPQPHISKPLFASPQSLVPQRDQIPEEDLEVNWDPRDRNVDPLWLMGFTVSLVAALVGLTWQIPVLTAPALVALVVSSMQRLLPGWIRFLGTSWWVQHWDLTLSWAGLMVVAVGGYRLSPLDEAVTRWIEGWDWGIVGALGDAFGAAGQVLIAVLAAYIAWRQYVISKDLTLQQNLITQQQTIDAYFQGISDLVLNPEGQLDDWPLERAIAEGRTAAILNGVNRVGKAKILRFLSMANLLSPLRRDKHLGRPILDGEGGYVRDRQQGVRVVSLRSILEKSDLQGTDLRGIDFSEASLSGSNLSQCDLSYVNFIGTDLAGAKFEGANLFRALLYVGELETATPATPGRRGNFKTGEFTGAIVENTDWTDVEQLSDEQRYYLCAWGGDLTRSTLNCQGIPNRLNSPRSSSVVVMPADPDGENHPL